MGKDRRACCKAHGSVRNRRDFDAHACHAERRSDAKLCICGLCGAPGKRLKRAFGSLPLMYFPVSAPPDSGLYASRPTLHCRGAHTWGEPTECSLRFKDHDIEHAARREHSYTIAEGPSQHSLVRCRRNWVCVTIEK